MRLIDADQLREKIGFHVTTMSVCSSVEEANAKLCMKNRCLEDVENAPTVDAIPVEWLKEQAKDNYDYSGTLIRGLLSEWWKEQRDGNGKEA